MCVHNLSKMCILNTTMEVDIMFLQQDISFSNNTKCIYLQNLHSINYTEQSDSFSVMQVNDEFGNTINQRDCLELNCNMNVKL